MKRTVEPELMENQKQAEAYAAADFSEADQLMVQTFTECFYNEQLVGPILDLGCGPGNITFGFAEQFPQNQVIGIDGSREMLQFASERKNSRPGFNERIQFIYGIIPHVSISYGPFSAIVSNSFLHHLHRPEELWKFINQYAKPGCRILIMDLFRPASTKMAQSIVEQYAINEPEILQRDFYNSLLAAFTPDEINQQLATANLTELEVRIVSDRHIIIVGTKR